MRTSAPSTAKYLSPWEAGPEHLHGDHVCSDPQQHTGEYNPLVDFRQA